jgi:tRNA (guanine-N7-)-methyltransferase
LGEGGFSGRTAARLLNACEREALQRRIPTFGRRRGRTLRSGQKDLLDQLLPRFAVSLPSPGPLDPGALFGRTRSTIWLEIGFGGGEHLALEAQHHPNIGFIGCEVFENGIVKLLAKVAGQKLDNIRIFADDARLLIAALSAASIDRVFIMFPDPWRKRRHHKRRIVSRETLDGLGRIMTDNAELRVASDDGDYVCWILERVSDHPAFEWLARRPTDWRERPQDWPATRYEQKARAAGRSPVFLRMRRLPRAGG